MIWIDEVGWFWGLTCDFAFVFEGFGWNLFLLETSGSFQAEGALFFHELGGGDGFVADGEADDGVALLDEEGCTELGGDVVGVVSDAGCGRHGDAGVGVALFFEVVGCSEVEDDFGVAGNAGFGPSAHDGAGFEDVLAGVDGHGQDGGDFGGGEDLAGVGDRGGFRCGWGCGRGGFGGGGVAAEEQEGCGEEGGDWSGGGHFWWPSERGVEALVLRWTSGRVVTWNAVDYCGLWMDGAIFIF